LVPTRTLIPEIGNVQNVMFQECPCSEWKGVLHLCVLMEEHGPTPEKEARLGASVKGNLGVSEIVLGPRELIPASNWGR
jgi:hypothetical protein